MMRAPARRAAVRQDRRQSRAPRAGAAAVIVTAVAGLLTTSACGVRAAAVAHAASSRSDVTGAAAAARVAPEPLVVPKPVSMTAGRGRYVLTGQTRIVVAAGVPAALAVARDLAGYLRPATGYPLPVVSGTPQPGDIALVLGSQAGLRADPHGEAYRLDVGPAGVQLAAATAHGLYDAVQTVRQTLPPWINSRWRRPGPWSMPAVRITDHPRYAYRGVMLDIARHYEPPSAVEQLISQAAAYKINVLHLHLSDDQGFRLAINGFPRLSRIGGHGSVGTHGRVRDPGGYWTQAQYKAVVADAAAHFVTVLPEVDTPGHNNAIIMSEYNDTGNRPLNGHPQDINCSVHHPPVWDYTEDVGYSALCPGSASTWAIMRSIIGQLAAMSPGPYYDMGGDEVPTTVLSHPGYVSFVNREAGIIRGRGKTVLGWADIAGPGTRVPRGSVAEYWQPASGSSPGTVTAREAVRKGMKLVMAPANQAYLDQKYIGGARGDVPPGLGQTWACPAGCDLNRAYDWNPGGLVTGVTDRSVIGVEGAVWSETLVNMANVDYMTFPRLIALAEVGWSPSARRAQGSPAWRDFTRRMAAQGGRLMAAGVNFYPSAEVRWRMDVTGSALTAGRRGRVSGVVAAVAVPGVGPGAVSALMHWGDGTTGRSGAAGRPPSATMLNSLYTVHGQHRYAHPGLYHGTVTVRAPHRSPVTVGFSVQVR
jgi:hexosaminidase